MSKFSIISASNDGVWDDFVEDSPQGTVFSQSCYLNSVDGEYIRKYLLKGNEVKAAFSLMLSDNRLNAKLDDLVIYNGIFFKDDKEKKATKARLERFEITQCIIDDVLGSYNNIEMAFSPQFEDLRPFLWYNYHDKNRSSRFELDLRYTSYIDISELALDIPYENTKLFCEMETLRKRNIKEAIRSEASVTVDTDVDKLIHFYRLLMESQNEVVSEVKLHRMAKLTQILVEKNKAVMFLTKNRSGAIIYITVFCFDSKRAYYLFGAGHPGFYERYKGTMSFWGAFEYLARVKGIKIVDFEGVNSPQRGWFKLSFGGTLLPYYQVFLKR